MKTTLIATLLAVSVFAADAPKTDLPSVPVEKQLELRTAQLQVARLAETLGRLASDYKAVDARLKEAQGQLEKMVSAIPKPKDCADCQLTDELSWQRKAQEVAKK